MNEALLGTLFGGLFRMLPELFKFLDRMLDRRHELLMFDKQIRLDELRAEKQIAYDLIDAANPNVVTADLQAILSLNKAQTTTPFKWINAIADLARPTITFWWVIWLYTFAICVQYWYAIQTNQPFITVVAHIWGPDEKSIVASIISFWFVDRTLKKMAR